jgi:K(+)-stimulated pyrophosphate-energized sodium pump
MQSVHHRSFRSSWMDCETQDEGQSGRGVTSKIQQKLMLLAAPFFLAGSALAAENEKVFRPFEFMHSPAYSQAERIALFASLFIAVCGLLYALMLMKQVRSADKGTAQMQAVADAVREGANAYLSRQLKTVGIMIGVLVIVLYVAGAMASELGFADPFVIGRAGSFLIGALFSGTVGVVGMRLATTGNLRVAAAAPKGFGRALMLGYRTGTITGMLTDGLGLLGGTLIFMIYGEHAYEALLGFGFGGTLLALFMRVGGGIYTKAADVGADLVGKIEKDIPEDDPRNAATIADNVGDNVGDCAGMAADIFESYEVTIVAAMILGWVAFGHIGVIFPILVRAIGVLASIISTYLVRASDKGSVAEAMKSINFGFVTGSVLSVIGFMTLGYFYLNFQADPTRPWIEPGLDMRPAWACLIGVVLCVALNKVTEYFTGTEYKPVKGLVENCNTGHATNIIEGLALGMESAVFTGLVLCSAIMASVMVYAGTNAIAVAYGVAMCGIGMLTLTGNTISMDVFGPVADNANGIGEMGYDREEMGEKKYKEARQVLADLDSVGNTTKAVTKGVAIGSAVIASVSLYASFITVIGSGGGSEKEALPIPIFDYVAGLFSIAEPKLLVGMLIGGAVPFLFSSMIIRAVGRAAYLIINECRAQFRDTEIWTGLKKPDYGRVVAICTQAAQKELIGPAALAVCMPILVGFLLGPIGLAGFLGGSIVAGQLLASFMCNSGGAWDNAKKTIEDEPRYPAENLGKGSERHFAAVTGDTVGDPLKDTAGPAVNPLLKVMNMVSILTVPLMITYDAVVVQRVTDAVALYNKNPLVQLDYKLPTNFKAVGYDTTWYVMVVVCAAAIAWAYLQSKRPIQTGEQDLPITPMPYLPDSTPDLDSIEANGGIATEESRDRTTLIR